MDQLRQKKNTITPAVGIVCRLVINMNCIDHISRRSAQSVSSKNSKSEKASLFLSSLSLFYPQFLLSHHKISGPSGQEQGTKQHCVAEENKFEDFPECPKAADQQRVHIQRLLWHLLLAATVSQMSNVLTPTHSTKHTFLKL